MNQEHMLVQAAAEASTHGTCLSAEAKAAVKAYVGAEITVHNTPQCDVKPEVNVDGSVKHTYPAV